MSEELPFMAQVTVRFSKRDDGGLVAECEDVRGFYLSGADRRAVMRDVPRAIQALVRRNLEINVVVHPLKYGIYWMKERLNAEQDMPEEMSYALQKVAA